MRRSRCASHKLAPEILSAFCLDELHMSKCPIANCVAAGGLKCWRVPRGIVKGFGLGRSQGSAEDVILVSSSPQRRKGHRFAFCVLRFAFQTRQPTHIFHPLQIKPWLGIARRELIDCSHRDRFQYCSATLCSRLYLRL